MTKQMTTKQSIIFVIVIANAVFIVMQFVNGQENSSSMVDKLIEDTKRDIEDTKREIIIEQSYRAELIKRIENSRNVMGTLN